MAWSRTALILSLTLLLALGILWSHGGRWSASAQPATTTCTGPLTGTFANVVVPASASCTLTNALVQGNVQVQSQARLVVSGASTIRGNVAATQCASVLLAGTVTVGGNVAIQRCTQASGYAGPGIQISGNVTCQDNTGACVAQSGTIGGSVVLQRNTAAAATDISRNSIRGNLTCQGNTPAPTHGLGPNVVTGVATGQCSVSLGFVTTNRAPVAQAGPDQTVAVGTTVTLDGRQSYALGGQTLRWRWAFMTRPPGSQAALADPTAVQPTFVADRSGTYTVQLIVNDGTRDSAPDTVEIRTQPNTPPVAQAGPDHTVVVGQTVTLDGSGSTDAEGTLLQYQWVLLTRPAGSQATLADATLVHPTLDIDRPGPYTVQLIVHDGTDPSAPDTVTLTTTNTLPVANAGPDQTTRVGTTVTLDGSGSTDVDGDALLFTWQVTQRPPASAAVLSDATLVKPTFVVDRAGTYEVALVVQDGGGPSAPDTVAITTENSPPVAHAGAPQTVRVDTIVTLDGSHSSDVDGQALTFQWALTQRPLGSAALLTDATGVHPTFVVDRPGTYIAQLTVHDGLVASTPATVTITTQNSAPVAHAGAPQSVVVGTTVTLDGSQSRDVDGDALTFAWTLTTAPAGSTALLTDPTGVHPTFAVDQPGMYIAQLIVHDGTVASAPVTVTITTQNSAPVAQAGPDQAVVVGATVQLDGRASTDADQDALTFHWAVTARPAGSTAALADPSAVAPTFVADVAGTYVVQLIVHDGTVASAPDTVELVASPGDTSPPAAVNPVLLTVEPVIDGQVTVRGATGSVEASAQVRLTNPRTGQTVTVSATVAGSFSATLPAQPGDSLTLTVVDAAGNMSPPTPATVGGPLPPAPATVAPPLALSEATTTLAATAFLYTGPTPIQTGVAPGAIAPTRAAVLRGQVLDRSGAPLPGVQVTILHHPEFGQTLTRADGMFDLAVNGGGVLIVDYQKGGFLSAQRSLPVPWQDYAWLPAVVLVPLDPQATTVDLTAPAPIQVARGSQMTDQDGTRQATLLFPQGTSATLVLPNGSTQALTALHVRATEYTVGANGPQAMPAALPPTSAYTYAVEFSVDEALAAGAREVRFSSPLPFYVENFLNFPVGTPVPLGSYDRAQGVWVPAASGRVLQLLSVTGGLADLDVTGDGQADGGATLAALALTDTERARLATLYPVGQRLWRVQIPHFSPWDCNWGFGPPDDAVTPAQDPEAEESLDNDCLQSGSIIGCQNQTLGEAVRVVGTGLGLHYQSDRVPGRTVANQIEIPLRSGTTFPASVRRIELELAVAGQLVRQSFPAPGPQQTTFTWDGRDAYGRQLQGSQPITVRLGYTYGGVYGSTVQFGAFPPTAITGSQTRQELTLWRTWQAQIGGAWDMRVAGLGGWTLSAHHVYDPRDQVVYRGDGQRQSVTTLGPTISTVAGTGTAGSGCMVGDGGPATLADACPQGLAVGPDGSLYLASPSPAHAVRRVTPDGRITAFAGTGLPCATPTGACGDGGPARLAQLSAPWSVAVGPDTSLYIGEVGRAVIRRVAPDGTITTVAGTGVAGFSGDGGPARLAAFSVALSLAVGPDNTLYIADASNRRIRRIDPAGIITTVAGTGVAGFSGDGGPATLARLSDPRGIALGPDGSLYIADTGAQRVRRVTPDGIIRTIAGTGVSSFDGDGGPATAASFRSPYAVAVGRDDTLYIVDQGNHRIRWLRPGGVINTLAGTGTFGTFGDGGLARQAALQNLETGLAVGPDGSVYVAQTANNLRIRRIAPLMDVVGLGGFVVAGSVAVPAADGSDVALFTAGGRHLQTLDALTGALRYAFAYDGAGRLATVTDGDGNVTTIERDSAGNPLALVGPFGQRTTLAVNPQGYLSRLTSPAGDTVQLSYTADGLLTGYTQPGGQVSQYAYDALGRLTSATDPSGAAKMLTRTGTHKDATVTLTSPLGRVTTYRVARVSTGALQQTLTDAAGVQSQTVIGPDGVQSQTTADGTTSTVVLGPDPRWGMQAPFASQVTVATPGGTVQTTTMQRTATLATPGDLLSLRTSSETVTINGRAFTTAYDAPSRTVTHTAPTGRRISAVIDVQGRPVQAQFGDLAPHSYTYDARGRLATATQGQGAASRTLTLAYSDDGFLASVTEALGQTLALATDASGRVTAQALPDGGLARFAYDANGNVSAITPPGRPAYTFSYTERDQIAAYTAPTVGAEPGQTHYVDDADRLPVRVERPDGQAVQFLYDNAGRVRHVALAAGDRSYSYDPTGRLRTRSTPTLTLTYAYDGGLPLGTTWSGTTTGSVSWTYDTDFRVSAYSVNGSEPITLQYDPDGLPTQVGDLSLVRNTQSGLVTGTALGSSSDTTTYDGFGAVASYTALHSGSPVYAANYTRDLLGRLSQQTETLGGTTRSFGYTYDPAGRLSEVRQDSLLIASYGYDTNGNRLRRTDGVGTTTATYDDQDRLLQDGTTIYTHSPAGERLSKTAGDQTTMYQYDGLGNLTGVLLPDGTQIAYLLDAQNRRIGRSVNGTLVQGWLYQDGLRPIVELDGAGAVVSRFVYATGRSVPDYLLKGGVTYRILTDYLGSPRMVVDIATGQMMQRMDHDAFGRVTLDTNPGFQPFGFAGGLYDLQTGLVHFGAREYDPETGRWTTKDPIGFAAGDENLYAYVGNDPVNTVDPEGLCVGSSLCQCALNPACATAVGLGARTGAEAIQRAAPVVQAVAQRAPAIVNAVRLTCTFNSPVVQNVVIPVQLYGPISELGKYTTIVNAIMRLRPGYSLRTAFEIAQKLAPGDDAIRLLRQMIAGGQLPRILTNFVGQPKPL